jgi:hypothetical protein
VLLAIVVAALAIGSMLDDSATADEAAHIAAGLLKLQQGRLDFYATQTPLIESLIAVPLTLAGYDAPRVEQNRPWVAGHRLLYRSGHDPARVLTLARLPVIALFLALCFAVFFYVRRVTSSTNAALGAFVLTGFCPTLLAHGRLATVDMGVTLFAFLAIAFVRGRGFSAAAALASKVSGILILPFLMRSKWRTLVIALGTFMLVYMLLGRTFDPTYPFRMYLTEINAVRGFYSQRHVLPQFLLGEFSRDGWPHYYLVALAVKTPIPVFVLFALAIVPAIRKRRVEVMICAAFAVLFLILSSFSSLNLGIRHILPIYPFVYAAIAISVFDAQVWIRRAAAVLIASHALIGIAAYPSYLSYFNAFVPMRAADRVLIDSNLDWGQDLRRLRHWTEDRKIARIHVHYFGGGNVEHEFGDRAVRWSVGNRAPLPKGAWFALSRHFYRLSFATPVDYDTYLRASNAQYVTTIGGSIDVYHVLGAPASPPADPAASSPADPAASPPPAPRAAARTLPHQPARTPALPGADAERRRGGGKISAPPSRKCEQDVDDDSPHGRGEDASGKRLQSAADREVRAERFRASGALFDEPREDAPPNRVVVAIEPGHFRFREIVNETPVRNPAVCRGERLHAAEELVAARKTAQGEDLDRHRHRELLHRQQRLRAACESDRQAGAGRLLPVE